LKSRGGLRPIDEVFAFHLDPDQRDDGQKLLIEAGLLVAFAVDGECAPVRAALLELQRRLGAGGGVVVEGRDTGTVVFPAADAKFFLIASEEERARRRAAELVQSGAAVDLDATLREIRERDQRDASRDVAPMVPAADAVVVDSSGQTIEQIVDSLATQAEARAAR
jgi:cytidylate kinase